MFDFITRLGWGTSGLVLNYITGAVVSSVVAGLETAPIAAIHFNQISQIGYIANLLAVPVMALVVAPAAVIALALSPLNLASVGFWFVEREIWEINWYFYGYQRCGTRGPQHNVLKS